jgi:ribosomal protein S8
MRRFTEIGVEYIKCIEDVADLEWIVISGLLNCLLNQLVPTLTYITTTTTMSTRLPTLPHRLCAHLVNTSQSALASTSLPYSTSSLAITSVLLRHGLISNLTLGTPTQASPSEFHSLPEPSKRIWVGLKYRNGTPVLKRLSLVSKPSQRRIVSNKELGAILAGKRALNVAGAGLGEVFVVRVLDREGRHVKGQDTFMEGWEAWRAGLGGELVCRAS